MAELAADSYDYIRARLNELEAARRGDLAPKQEPLKVPTPQADEDDELLAQILMSGGF